MSGFNRRTFEKQFANRSVNKATVNPLSIARYTTTNLQESSVIEVAAARFVENGAGTYTHDFYLPPSSVLVDVRVHAEALWAAATSASMLIGTYLAADDADGLGAVINATSIYPAINLKAADLTVGQTVTFNRQGSAAPGEAGAMTSEETSFHFLDDYDADARIVRAVVTSVGAGTAGRTIVTCHYACLVDTIETVTQ